MMRSNSGMDVVFESYERGGFWFWFCLEMETLVTPEGTRGKQ